MRVCRSLLRICCCTCLVLFGCIAAQSHAAGHPLNDTGITWYGNANQNNLLSPPAGYEGQDADYGRDALARAGTLSKVGGGNAGFDFTKLDANGNALPASATSWSCVRDNHTGLTWEVKTDDGGLRDKDWGYTWYNSDPATNGGAVGTASGGSCYTSGRCDTEKYVADVNAQGLCSAADWRMPSKEELLSIVDNSRTNPSIDTAYFPNTLSSYFWSSSPKANYSHLAWYVYFGYGFVYGSNRYSGYHVRLVRAGQ